MKKLKERILVSIIYPIDKFWIHPAFDNFVRQTTIVANNPKSAFRATLKNDYGLTLIVSRNGKWVNEFILIKSEQDRLAWSSFCLEWS